MRLSHLACCINSASNFLIYYVNGTKFREAWCEIYGPFFKHCFSLKPDDNFCPNNDLPRITLDLPTITNSTKPMIGCSKSKFLKYKNVIFLSTS